MTDPAIEGMRLAEKATPGPWKLWGSEVRADPTGTSDLKDSVLVCDPVMTPDPENGRLRCPDSYFIAHAGTHYASICKRALDAEAKLAGARPNGWKYVHDRDEELIYRDGLMCEKHPGYEWPHLDCPGPGMAWTIEGRALISAMARVVEAAVAFHTAWVNYDPDDTDDDPEWTEKMKSAVETKIAFMVEVRAYKEASRG